MSKGSSPRPFSVDRTTFDQNWNMIFSQKETKMQVKVDQISEGGTACGCGHLSALW